MKRNVKGSSQNWSGKEMGADILSNIVDCWPKEVS